MALGPVPVVNDEVIRELVGADLLTAPSPGISRPSLLTLSPLLDSDSHHLARRLAVNHLLTPVDEDLKPTRLVSEPHSRISRVLMLSTLTVPLLEDLLQIAFPHRGVLDRPEEGDHDHDIARVLVPFAVRRHALNAMTTGFRLEQVDGAAVGDGERPLARTFFGEVRRKVIAPCVGKVGRPQLVCESFRVVPTFPGLDLNADSMSVKATPDGVRRRSVARTGIGSWSWERTYLSKKGT